MRRSRGSFRICILDGDMSRDLHIFHDGSDIQQCGAEDWKRIGAYGILENICVLRANDCQLRPLPFGLA